MNTTPSGSKNWKQKKDHDSSLPVDYSYEHYNFSGESSWEENYSSSYSYMVTSNQNSSTPAIYEQLKDSILDNLNIGLVAIDTSYNIAYYNNFLSQVLIETNYLNIKEKYLKKLSNSSLLGKNILEVFPESRLPQVIETGRPEVGEVRKAKEEYFITSRFPLFNSKGDIIGAAAKIFLKNFDELKELSAKVESLNTKLRYYENELKKNREAKTGLHRIETRNKKMIDIKKVAFTAASTASTILISGESGTGKDHLAESIHQSSRAGQPYIAMNCAAIPETLLEAELFGYSAGAFTGALNKGKIGKLETADKGTLFLDEIGDMSYQLQAKLLRFLQNRTFFRLGGDESISVDVRIIAATNKNLEKMLEENRFREDLYYRLNVIRLELPPLRERIEDIEILTNSLIAKYNPILGCQIDGATPEVLEVFQQYWWPGNIRELENLIERTMNFVNKGTIELEHLPAELLELTHQKPLANTKDHYRESNSKISGEENQEVGENNWWSVNYDNETLTAEDSGSSIFKLKKQHTEKELIKKTLDEVHGNKSQAAKKLGISRTWLYKKLREYGIS